MNTLLLMRLMWGIWLVYNLFVFFLYGADKRKAKKGKWRVPERTLLTCAWLMGGVGAFLGMKAFHHKTLHKQFAISCPIAAILSISVMLYLTVKLL